MAIKFPFRASVVALLPSFIRHLGVLFHCCVSYFSISILFFMRTKMGGYMRADQDGRNGLTHTVEWENLKEKRKCQVETVVLNEALVWRRQLSHWTSESVLAFQDGSGKNGRVGCLPIFHSDYVYRMSYEANRLDEKTWNRELSVAWHQRPPPSRKLSLSLTDILSLMLGWC